MYNSDGMYKLEMRLSDYIERHQKDLIFEKIAEQCLSEQKSAKERLGPINNFNESNDNMTEHKQAEQLVSVKNDAGKPRYDLLPVAPIREMAEVLEFGSRKYDSNNWRSANPVPLSRHYAAVQRHLNQWWSGEDMDPESGMRHLAHAATTIMFIMELSKSRPQSDDRFKDCAPYNEVK